MIGLMSYEPVHDIWVLTTSASSEGSDHTVQSYADPGGDRGSGLPYKSQKYSVS